MNIYEIGQDFDNYKFFVFKEDDESNKGVWDYNGQSLINEWKGLSLELFRDKRKKKDKRSEEFDASCYFSGCLIVNKRTSLLLSEKLKGQIEVLPVNVDGNASGYYFINVLNTVDALNIESKSNEEILKSDICVIIIALAVLLVVLIIASAKEFLQLLRVQCEREVLRHTLFPLCPRLCQGPSPQHVLSGRT